MRWSSCRPIPMRCQRRSRRSRKRAYSSPSWTGALSDHDNSVRIFTSPATIRHSAAVAGEYIKNTTPNAEVVVIRGLPIADRQAAPERLRQGDRRQSNVKVLDKQFGNWSRDDAFKIMQDYLTKFPKIDAVWCQDDDMAVGVLEAIDQAKRTDIQMVIGGAGMKDMIKRVMPTATR